MRRRSASSVRIAGTCSSCDRKLGIVSADLHDRFVHGNSNGVVTGLDAVVSGFFATHGVFAHQRVTEAMRRQAMEALERVDAARLARATLDTMSTGEARRVLIARALVHQPAALVLDEPTRGLDLVARHHFMERVRAVARQGRRFSSSPIMSTRSSRRSRRVILLRRGRVACDGAKADVLTSDAPQPRLRCAALGRTDATATFTCASDAERPDARHSARRCRDCADRVDVRAKSGAHALTSDF